MVRNESAKSKRKVTADMRFLEKLEDMDEQTSSRRASFRPRRDSSLKDVLA